MAKSFTWYSDLATVWMADEFWFVSRQSKEKFFYIPESVPALERFQPPIQWVLPAVVWAAGGWGAKRLID